MVILSVWLNAAMPLILLLHTDTVYLSLIFLSGFPFHVAFLFGGLGPITSERGKAWDMDAGTIILQMFFLLNSCISTLPFTRPSIFLAYFYIFASLNALLHDFTRGTIPIHSLTSQDPPSPTVTPEPTCILFPLPLTITIQTTDLFPPHLAPKFLDHLTPTSLLHKSYAVQKRAPR